MATNATLPPVVIPIPADIAVITGPLFIGNLFNWGLYGVLCVQAYIYYLAFPGDKLLPKALVASVMVIETLQTVLVTRDAFREFGSGWGNLEILDEVALLWFSVPVMTAVISSIVQIFFAWRIYILSKKPYIPILVILISLTQCAGGIWSGVFSLQIGHFSKIQNRSKSQTIVWLGGTSIVDTLITASMIFYLSRSRTGFRTTNTLVTKFIRVTVETGLICTTFAIIDLAFFIGLPGENFHLTPAISLSKLYSNSLLVLLNARVRLVGGRNVGSTVGDTTLSVNTWSDTQTDQYSKKSQLQSIGRPGINVEVKREMRDDSYAMVDSSKFRRDSITDPSVPDKDTNFMHV